MPSAQTQFLESQGSDSRAPAGTGHRAFPGDEPLQYVKGVGPHLAALLSKIGLNSVNDLLHHFPRRWEDRTHFRHAADVQAGEFVTVCGTIVAAVTRAPRPGMQITEVLLDDSGSALKLIWFNQPYLEKLFKGFSSAQRPVVVYGQVKRNGWNNEMITPEWEPAAEAGDTLSMGRIVPIYALAEGLSQARMRRLIFAALESFGDLIEEPLPAEVLLSRRLIGIRAALKNIHFPETESYRAEARKRLVFEEFFVLQAMLAVRRLGDRIGQSGIRFDVNLQNLQNDLSKIVPFRLTGAQQRAIGDIALDVSGGNPMNRLIQGDVGSGKTMVALGAILMALENGYQAALMAPTEILAQQHAIVLRRLLEPHGVAVELTLGSQRAKLKREIKDRLLGGQSQVAIGTHALIQESVEFHRLGLVIIDEQHRFGVLQRQALVQKGVRPHALIMTATPIPRTLTLTLYGDLDVTVLDELPPGRKAITTHWKSGARRSQVYEAARGLLQAGRQLYVVCPLIEESEKLQAKSAINLSEQISVEVFPEFRVDLLHGQMTPEEKDAVMARFKAHQTDVLVSTTVIEVGIDVPNASIIVIEDADRFGLAQLHQLRGRVGRGSHASFCILISEPKTDEGRRRMEVMTETQDGFKIAEEDLRLRGPGEYFGTRQSGLPSMLIGDVVEDADVLEDARAAASEIVVLDPTLNSLRNHALRECVERMRARIDVLQVG